MALLEELIARITDADLRRDLDKEVRDLKGNVKWASFSSATSPRARGC
ncbi:MAG: hypothetical protein H0U86_17330 [Chloroflexi bacterium]|nr:hypothetical protein [Chloroflexota bacterium]